MNSRLFKTVLLSTSLVFTACASTASGKSQSILMTGTAAPQQLKAPTPDGSLLAVVRYPAVVSENAKDKYRESYAASAIGGRVDSSVARTEEARGMIDSTIVKSNYFALSLYKELAARLPEHTVLLSPHEIILDANDELTSVPITQAESLPSVVTIDFAAYTFPNPKKMMDKNPLTFGDLISPIVTVRTDHRAAVPTQGVLLTSQPLTESAVGNGYQSVQASMDELQSGRFETDVPELDFIAMISGDPKKSTATQGLSLTAGANSVQIIPMEKIRMSGQSIMALDKTQAGIVDPLQPVFSQGFANRIVDLINDTASEKTAMGRRADAIASYDPSLAALTFVGSDSTDYLARYNYALRMLDAERKYLSVQSLRLFDGVHNSEMGAQVRDMLKAEYGILDKRRELARKQNQATAFAILGAVATGAAIANSSGSNNGYPNYAEQLLTQVALNAAIYAGASAFAYRDESRAVGGNYLASIVPALEEQTNVQVSLIDSNETITAVRFDDLKTKLKALYDQKQRSLETIATRCAFNQSGAATGTWMGVCEGGVASGSGVGVIKNADGSAIEYYGHAQNGMAQGPGYMIFHSPTGSHALEGNFTAGRADGTMRLSKSGRDDHLRNYVSGSDTGSAPSSAAVASPFNRMRTGA